MKRMHQWRIVTRQFATQVATRVKHFTPVGSDRDWILEQIDMRTHVVCADTPTRRRQMSRYTRAEATRVALDMWLDPNLLVETRDAQLEWLRMAQWVRVESDCWLWQSFLRFLAAVDKAVVDRECHARLDRHLERDLDTLYDLRTGLTSWSEWCERIAASRFARLSDRRDLWLGGGDATGLPAHLLRPADRALLLRM